MKTKLDVLAEATGSIEVARWLINGSADLRGVDPVKRDALSRAGGVIHRKDQALLIGAGVLTLSVVRTMERLQVIPKTVAAELYPALKAVANAS